MLRLIRAVVGLVAGYALGAVAGAALISLFSGNTHDKSLEMAMTAAFVTGPMGAVLGCIIGLMLPRRTAGDSGSTT